LILLTEIY